MPMVCRADAVRRRTRGRPSLGACFHCVLGAACITSNALKNSADNKMKETKETPAAPTEPAATEEDLAAGEPVSEGPLSPEEVHALKALAAKAQEHYDQLLRTTADFENFKKRVARERQEAVRYANEALLQKLIPILDNFDMAISAAASAKEGPAQSLQTGVNMILSQMRNALTEAGLEEIDATGKAFDPNFHEAVSQQETDEAPEGRVIQQLRRGYKLRDRLLRPATVVVSKKPEAQAP